MLVSPAAKKNLECEGKIQEVCKKKDGQLVISSILLMISYSLLTSFPSHFYLKNPNIMLLIDLGVRKPTFFLINQDL